MLVVFYRVVLQTCASPELSFLVPAQAKLNLLKLTGNVNMSLIMQAILAELTNENLSSRSHCLNYVAVNQQAELT